MFYLSVTVKHEICLYMTILRVRILIFQTGKKRDPAHNSDQKNLMFPISPSVNPIVTSQQCQIAKQSKIVRNNIDKYYDF
ncbi:hypothetical protein GCM10020331_012770 [Ectobacillus funiculus]